MRMSTDKVDVEVEAEAEGLFHPAVEVADRTAARRVVGWLLEAGEELPARRRRVRPRRGRGAGRCRGRRPSAAAPAAAAPLERTGRLFVTPNARRVAGERGIDVAQLRGTGPNGRIITADVLEAPAAAAAAAARVECGIAAGAPRRCRRGRRSRLGARERPGREGAPRGHHRGRGGPVPAEPGCAAEVIPLTGMRGVIASRMHASLHEMAQLTLGTDATMDAAVALRAQLKEQWAGRHRRFRRSPT